MHENEFSILREIVIFPDHELSNYICTTDNPCHICNDARRRISIAVVWDGINKKGIKLKEYNKVTNNYGKWRETDWGIDFGDNLSNEQSFQQALFALPFPKKVALDSHLYMRIIAHMYRIFYKHPYLIFL